MNRNNEYFDLLKQLEQPVPALAYTPQRAEAKQKKRSRILKPLASFAVICLTFVLAVNFCTPIADACSKIPILKELARAVTFSKSLTDAVDNEYVQPISLKETKKGITISVEYLIVDKKQVNIFFRVSSDKYQSLNITPEIKSSDNSHLPCVYSLNEQDVPNGELQSVTAEFIDEDVPDSMNMVLKLYDQETEGFSTAEDPDFPEITDMDSICIAAFQFQLNFDPDFTTTGKTLSVNKTVDLDGQKVTFTDIEIYPTHMRIGVKSHKANTKWLSSLDLYVLADGNKKFKALGATGSTESREMDSFHCDSTYFYNAEELTIVVTGGRYLDKENYRYRVNLATGESDQLPFGSEIISTKQKGNRWKIQFSDTDKLSGSWLSHVSDAQGKQYHINMWDSLGNIYFEDYPEDIAWLEPYYDQIWKAKTPIMVPIK